MPLKDWVQIGILLLAVGGAWGSINVRVDRNEKWIASHTTQEQVQTDALQKQIDQAKTESARKDVLEAMLEAYRERLANMEARLVSMDQKLDRLMRRQ